MNLEEAKDIFGVQHVEKHMPDIDLCLYHNRVIIISTST